MKLSVLAALIALPLSLCAAPLFQQDIEYGRAGGERLLLDLSIPDGPGPHPAVILVHGGAWRRGDKNGGSMPGRPGRGLIAPMQEPLSKAGYAWFTINYRLAPKHAYPACIEDVETAIRWVKTHAAEYNLDPGRIALAGESAGGHLVALAAMRADDSTHVAAVIPFYPITDFPALYPKGSDLGELADLFGSTTVDDKVLALLREASPQYAIKPGLPPFLIVHGDADRRVPYAQSVAFKNALDAAGVPCRLMTIPGAGHGMANWDKTCPGFQDNVINWLDQTLGRGTKNTVPDNPRANVKPGA